MLAKHGETIVISKLGCCLSSGIGFPLHIWGWVKTLVPSEPQNSWYLWMFIPLKMVFIGIDPYLFDPSVLKNIPGPHFTSHLDPTGNPKWLSSASCRFQSALYESFFGFPPRGATELQYVLEYVLE